MLKRALASHLDVEDSGASIQLLQDFGVADGVTFEKYLPALELLISTAQAMVGVHYPPDGRVMVIARASLRNQFPTMTISLFAGEKDLAELPYTAVASMLAVFKTVCTNRTPAINGGKYVFFRVSRVSANRPASVGHSSFSREHIANISKTGNSDDTDVETTESYYPEWPLRRLFFSEVLCISRSFATTDIDLWNRLLNVENRSPMAREHRGHCGGTGSSVKQCPEPFLKTTNALSPAITNLSDPTHVF